MKHRPRQIDVTKPLTVINNLEEFNNSEGQMAETKYIDKIITPDMLLLEKPKQFTEPTLKSQLPNKCREDYIAYRLQPYPDATSYELTDEDILFLAAINGKLQSPVSGEDFELFLCQLESKSGKDLEIDFNDFLKLKINLPKTITNQSQQTQEQLYNYFKKQRQQLTRPLTRFLMHPYEDDQNPHVAFRPRVQATDRTMKLRRENAQNQKKLQEMEHVGQKIVSLKRDLAMTSGIIEQCLQREKAMEIERRFQFCKFIKEFYDQSKKDKDTEVKLWSKDCFVKECQEKCSINIQERGEEMFDLMNKEITKWKETNDIQRKEKNKREDNINKYEKLFEEIIKEKVTKGIEQIPGPIENPGQIINQHIKSNTDIIYPPPPPPPPPQFVDERMESVAKFLSTLYLEARKFQLTFEGVLSDQFPICKPINYQKIIAQQSLYPYKLVQLEGNDLVYKVNQNSILEEYERSYWENYTDPTLSSALYYQHYYFKEKVDNIMQLADMDQMIYHSHTEDDKLYEVEQKQITKKIKTSHTRSNGTSSILK